METGSTYKTPSESPKAMVNRSLRFILRFHKTNQGNMASTKSIAAV